MSKIIPEKMVEIWTTRTLIKRLGNRTSIWSPTHGADQGAVLPANGKRVWLELKSPEWIWDPGPGVTVRWPQVAATKQAPAWYSFPPGVEAPGSSGQTGSRALHTRIGISQLLRYVDLYGQSKKQPKSNGLDSDVLYVLPEPSKYALIAQSPTIDWSSFHVRNTFGRWAYVIRASRLLFLLGFPAGTQRDVHPQLKTTGRTPKGSVPLIQRSAAMGRYDSPSSCAYVHLDLRGSPQLCYRNNRIDVERFDRFLRAVKHCYEEDGLAHRGPGARPRTKRPGDDPAPLGLQDTDEFPHIPADPQDGDGDGAERRRSTTARVPRHLVAFDIAATF